MSCDISEDALDLEPRVIKKQKIEPINDDEDSWREDFNYISMLRGIIRTRGKTQDPKENLINQIAENPLILKCIPHPKLIDYLIQNKFYDLDDYVTHCNKKGVLFEVPIKQYYAEPIEYPKYNQYQMLEIHKKNKIQRELESMMVEVRQLKTSKNTQKTRQPNNLIKFYDPQTITQEIEIQEKIKNQRTLGRTIKQLKQLNLVERIKPIYEESPLDQPILEGLIEERIKHFIQYKLELVKEFQPFQKQKESQVEQIYYDELSDDSLDTVCNVHPKDRVGFQTLFFQNRVQVIGAIHLAIFDSQIQQFII